MKTYIELKRGTIDGLMNIIEKFDEHGVLHNEQCELHIITYLDGICINVEINYIDTNAKYIVIINDRTCSVRMFSNDKIDGLEMYTFPLSMPDIRNYLEYIKTKNKED